MFTHRVKVSLAFGALTTAVLTVSVAVNQAAAGPALIDHVDHARIQVDGVGEVTQERIYPTAAGRDINVSNQAVWAAAKTIHPDLGGDNEYVQFVCNRFTARDAISWDVEPGRVALDFWATVDRGCDNPVWYPDATTR